MSERDPVSPRDETEADRLDRNLSEMLQELRVVLPGVQVLFAFLLAAPFATGFQDVSSFDRDVYLVTLLSAAVCVALLVAPSAQHRITFRLHDKEHVVVVGNRMAIAALGFLALSMTGAILLITDFLFGPAVTVLATAGTAATFIVLWYVLPSMRRAKLDR